VANLTAENTKLKSRAGTSGPVTETVAKPPPEDVKGRVLDTDPKTGLVTISIGSDAGIAKGQTLEVYRIRPEPKYLGSIRILDAHHHEAVGRPISPQRNGAIQKGDEVASTILGQR
jgi:hypothetical protein